MRYSLLCIDRQGPGEIIIHPVEGAVREFSCFSVRASCYSSGLDHDSAFALCSDGRKGGCPDVRSPTAPPILVTVIDIACNGCLGPLF